MRRTLGYIETLCAIGHEELYGAAQAVFVADVRGPLTEELLRDGLEMLRRSQPPLCARIERTDRDYAFVVEDPPPPLPLTVGARDPEDIWRARMADEYRDPIGGATGLWRVAALLDPDPARGEHVLLLSMHHALVDGVVAQRFVDDLLRACAACHAGEPSPLAPQPMPRPIEERLRRRTHWAEFVAAVQADLAGWPTPPPWPFAACVPAERRIPCTQFGELDAATLAGLHARARGAGTTVNAAFAAAMLRAAAGLAGGSLVTSIGTSVSLRPFADLVPGEADFGCSMINVRTAHAVGPDDELWALARAYREQLRTRQAAQANTPVDFDVAALRRRFDRATVDRATAYVAHLGLSNLGVYPHPQRRGPFELERLMFTTSRRAALYAGFLHVVTVGGRAPLCLSYVEPLLDGGWAAAFVAATLAELRAAAGA